MGRPSAGQSHCAHQPLLEVPHGPRPHRTGHRRKGRDVHGLRRGTGGIAGPAGRRLHRAAPAPLLLQGSQPRFLLPRPGDCYWFRAGDGEDHTSTCERGDHGGAAVGDERQRHADEREASPLTMAMFTMAWPMIQVITLDETMRANVSWVRVMTLKTAVASTVKSPRIKGGAGQPEFFAEDGEDEVVVGFRDPVPFLPALAESYPELAARGEGVLAVQRLVALRPGRRPPSPCTKPGRNTANPVAAGGRQDQDRHRAEGAGDAEDLHPYAAVEHGSGEDHHDDHGRAKVAAKSDKSDDEGTGRKDHRDDSVLPFAEECLFAGEDGCRPDNQREFGEL